MKVSRKQAKIIQRNDLLEPGTTGTICLSNLRVIPCYVFNVDFYCLQFFSFKMLNHNVWLHFEISYA